MEIPVITMLNAMAGSDLETALRVFREWGIKALDLKDSIFGKGVADLSPQEARRAAGLIADEGFTVQCLSSVVFDSDIEAGEAAFTARHWPAVERIAEVASIMRPRWVRLLAAQTSQRREISDSVAHIRQNHPWVPGIYRRAIDRLEAAGCRVAIENEVGSCIFSTPAEIVDFFNALERPGRVRLIWDVQNLWSMGAFPSLDTYRMLKPLLCSLHLKGGRCDMEGGPLRRASTLADASWPVAEIVRQVVADEAVDSICLNPSHGERTEALAMDMETLENLRFVRDLLRGLAS